MKRRVVIGVTAALLAASGGLFWARHAQPGESSAPAVSTAAAPVSPAQAARAPEPAMPTSPDASVAPSDTMVSGKVIDEDGNPVSGVTLELDPKDGGPTGMVRNADGTFHIGILPRGHHAFVALHEDFVPEEGELDAPGTLEIRLRRGATLVGDVADEDGNPMEAMVTAESKVDPRVVKVVREATHGQFKMQGMIAGEYELVAGVAGDQQVVSRVKLPATGTATVHLKAARGLAISGMVVTTDGVALPGAIVSATQGHLRPRQAQTDGDGGFRLRGLEPGTWQLLVMSQDMAPAQNAVPPVTAPASGLRFEVQLQPHVKGRLVDTRHQAITRFSIGSAAYTSDDGRFDYRPEHLPAKVVISAPGYAERFETLGDLEHTVDLGDVVLGDGRSVTVVATDPAGRPVAGALVIDQPPAQGPDAQRRGGPIPSSANRATTDASGRARLDHLEEGQTLLWVVHAPDGTVQAKVAPGQALVEVKLGAAASVHGVVRERDGGALLLGDVDAELEGAPRRKVWVDQAGRYQLDDLAPGRWKLTAYADGTRFSEPVYVTLEPGAKRELDISLAHGVALRIVMKPPLEFDFDEMVSLVPGDRTRISSAAELRAAMQEKLMLNAEGGGLWTSPQATPGTATVVVERFGDDAVELRTGLLDVPPNGGEVSVTLSEPRSIPRKH